MQVIPVDSANNLFHIRDILPQELVSRLESLDWMAMQSRNDPTEMLARRSLVLDHPLLIEANTIIIERVKEIQEIIGVQFNQLPGVNNTNWWVDLPDFTSPIHIDTDIAATMQLYWFGPAFVGTTFFEENGKTIRKMFEFKTNTGYIVLNQSSDHSIRTVNNWHAMLMKVPKGQFRVSSYTGFTDYTDK